VPVLRPDWLAPLTPHGVWLPPPAAPRPLVLYRIGATALRRRTPRSVARWDIQNRSFR